MIFFAEPEIGDDGEESPAGFPKKAGIGIDQLHPQGFKSKALFHGVDIGHGHQKKKEKFCIL